MSLEEGLIPRIEKRLTGLGLNKSQSDWLMRALHPALPSRADARAPMGGTRPTAVVHYVKEREFTNPGGGSWDLILFSTNGDSTAALGAVRVGGTEIWRGFDQAPASPYAYTTADPCVVMRNVDLVPTATSYVLTDVHNIVPGAVPGPTTDSVGTECRPFPVAVEGWLPNTHPVSWRRLASSITAINTSASLNDGGTVTAGCYPALVTPSDGTAFTWPGLQSSVNRDTIKYQNTEAVAVSALEFIPSYYSAAASSTYQVPMEEAEMVQMNEDVYVGPAREGVYVVTKMNRFDWVEPGSAKQLASTGILAGDEAHVVQSLVTTTGCTGLDAFVQGTNALLLGLSSDIRVTDQVFTARDRGTSVSYVPGVTTDSSLEGDTVLRENIFSVAACAQQEAGRQGTAPLAFPVYSTGLDDAQTSVILFTGLTGPGSIRVKTVCVYELAVDTFSPLVAVTNHPEEPCDAAIQAYGRLAYELPHGVVASENGLGTLLYGIWELVKGGIAPMGRLLTAFGDTVAPPGRVMSNNVVSRRGTVADALDRQNIKPSGRVAPASSVQYFSAPRVAPPRRASVARVERVLVRAPVRRVEAVREVSNVKRPKAQQRRKPRR